MKEDDRIKQNPINISIHTHTQLCNTHADNSAAIATGKGMGVGGRWGEGRQWG